MPENMNWSVAISAIKGPQITSTGKFDVEGYEKLAIALPAGTTTAKGVAVGPGNWTAITLLVIVPSAASAKVKFATGSTSGALDAPLTLIGAGAIAMLGAGAAKLDFTNSSTEDITLEILVGRSAS